MKSTFISWFFFPSTVLTSLARTQAGARTSWPEHQTDCFNMFNATPPNSSTIPANISTVTDIPKVFSTQIDILLKVLYIIVTLAGITGNCLIIFLVTTKRVNQSAFNILLTNLSFADLAANISLYPYVFIDIKGFDVSKSTGTVICNFTIGLQLFFTCASVSLLTLTIISLNRYISINYPLKFAWQHGKRGSKITIICSWIFALITICPNFVSFTYMKDWGICKREWPSGINGQLYSILTAFLGLVVPATVLIYTFCATVKNLRTKVEDLQFASAVRQKSRKRTMFLLGWLVIIFCVCWSPFFIYWILSRSANVFDKGNVGDYQRMRVIRWTILIASLNTVADPFLYGLFSEQFRRALKMLLRNSTITTASTSGSLTTSLSLFPKLIPRKISEPSCYSVQAIDKEVSESLTPKSIQTIARIRENQRIKNFQITTTAMPLHVMIPASMSSFDDDIRSVVV